MIIISTSAESAFRGRERGLHIEPQSMRTCCVRTRRLAQLRHRLFPLTAESKADERPGAAPPLDESGRPQSAVGLRHRVGSEAELEGQLANGRQTIAGQKPATGDRRRHLRPHLFGRRGLRTGIQTELHMGIIARLRPARLSGYGSGEYRSRVAVKIGIGLFTGQIPAGSSKTFEHEYRDTLDLVRLAEALGFDSAWVSEHHGSSDGYFPSLLPMLAAFAAVTERMQLGTGIVLTPFHDPLRLAEDAATVDQLSGGRLILGLGIGWREEEFRMFGVPMSERLQRTVETIEILRRAWTGRRFSFEGRSFRYDRVKVTPTPARPDGPPIFLGGYVEKALRRAGRLADGYITDADSVEDVRPSLALFDEGARGVGKDPRRLGLALIQSAFPWRDGDAWEVVRDGVVQQLGCYGAWEAGADTPENDALQPIPPDEETMRKWTASGTPEQVAHALRPLVEAFGDRGDLHLIVRLHYPGMDFRTASRATELFAEEVIPALRGS